MYDATKKEEMLKSGFWPILAIEDGEEIEMMATAMGNLLYNTSMFTRFSLKRGRIIGEGPGIIIVFKADK